MTSLKVCISDFVTTQRVVKEHEGLFIVIIKRSDGKFIAFEDRCSHADIPLADGAIDEKANCIECPAHGAKFDLSSGAPLCLPAVAPIQIFTVSEDLENGFVHIEVS